MINSMLATGDYAAYKSEGDLHDVLRASYFSSLIRTVFHSSTICPTVLFTAAHRGCGVSYICSSIALELGAAGNNKVLLADAQAIVAMAGQKKMAYAPERVGATNVSVLGAKHVVDAASSLALLFAPVTSVFERMAEEFTHIIIDAPAVAVSDLSLRMSTFVDGVIFIAEAGKTEKRQIKAMQRQFTALGAHVLGAVYNAY